MCGSIISIWGHGLHDATGVARRSSLGIIDERSAGGIAALLTRCHDRQHHEDTSARIFIAGNWNDFLEPHFPAS